MSSSKKQKLAHEQDDRHQGPEYAALLADVHAEVDLEIALRLRLAETLAARISWAQSLQDAIRRGNGSTSAESFRTTALNTLAMIEEPTRFITEPEPVPPPSTTHHTFARPAPRKPVYSYTQVEFLYTRSSSLLDDGDDGGNQLYILKCPVCGRTTFSKLQGLLNHARMRHALEWGTHDECIRACAVPDNNLDTNAGVEVGFGIPGLRTLFRNAVGSKGNLRMQLGQNLMTATDNKHQETRDGETHLNQTLGLHADSPSLAPFLGKDVIRRQIKTWDSEYPIEIEDVSSGKQNKSRPWRMPFAPRNAVDISLSDSSSAAGKDVDSVGIISTEPSHPSEPGVVSGEGRFHFVARIIITDRSMALREDANVKGYTHKWMISVDAPSYAHPITSILHGIKVTPSNPETSMPIPREITSPPFAIVGLADKAFLARVELSFAGTSNAGEDKYQKMVFEHWVDLDPLKLHTVVSGQDQVLDVELDKNTVLQTPQHGYTSVESKLLWNQPLQFDQPTQPLSESDGTQSNPGLSLIANGSIVDDHKFSTLLKLVERFPLLRTDTTVNSQQSSDVPYTLASSQAQFDSMLLGRRKAIEWRRVRAIRDAYNDAQETSSSVISATEVYNWLSDNGRLPHSKALDSVRVRQEGDDEALSGGPTALSTWCAICGLHSSKHPNIDNGHKVEYSTTQQSIGFPFGGECTCGALQIMKLPRIDVHELASDEKRHLNSQRTKDCRSLVSMTDPGLLLSIWRTANSLNLSTLRAHVRASGGIMGAPSYPLDSLGADRFEVETQLAPYAVLAVATRRFISMLVVRGLEVANRDKVVSSGIAPKGANRRREDHAAAERLLTPTHILSGILSRGRGMGKAQETTDAVVLSCLSKLGVAVDSRSSAPSR